MKNELNAGKRKLSIMSLIVLQLIVAAYTMAGVMGKFAAGEEFMSLRFILFYAAEIGILGVYAILWQQIIKRMELSIAYANRSIALLWSMLWAAILFKESVSIQNIMGVLIVIAGTIIVNTDHE